MRFQKKSSSIKERKHKKEVSCGLLKKDKETNSDATPIKIVKHKGKQAIRKKSCSKRLFIFYPKAKLVLEKRKMVLGGSENYQEANGGTEAKVRSSYSNSIEGASDSQLQAKFQERDVGSNYSQSVKAQKVVEAQQRSNTSSSIEVVFERLLHVQKAAVRAEHEIGPKGHQVAFTMSWVLGRDFNTVLDPMEMRGGGRILSQIRSFKEFTLKAKVVNILMQGSACTWSNNRKKASLARLDRFLVSPIMLLWLPNIFQSGLSRNLSDHKSIIIGESLME
ncbi:hypothetical protein Ddye_011520 [Dipteronia dyeriana]|uniref:Uncharacterized protein n=1 Tax=Dipteronia dyeriana TaxID=168575 RepID=A0AAD9X2M6_9ROSI|nr:hypothetical protein Ddye_011520 [Dipteronia dyeriana]